MPITDELIFAGNARRSSLGLAEVSLVFANDGEWLDLPYNEVRITRRAYRSGENEYLLNGARVRLREIVDLLAGASIHAGGHVVVGQGLVDAVLSLRSEERRPVIESLAGLKQYYLRRDEAETRLSQTEANLVHVDALVAELAPQLESLAQQAEVLRDYRAAEGELRRLQQLTYGVQAARLKARVQVARHRNAQAAEDRDTARQRAQELAEEDDALGLRLDADRAARDALHEHVQSQQALTAASRRDSDVSAMQLKGAEERAELAAAEHARLASTAERERAALRQAERGADEIRAEQAAVEARLAASRAAYAGCARQRDRAAVEERRAQGMSEEASRIAARLAEAVALSTASVESVARELERQEAQAATAVAASNEADQALAGATSILPACEATRAAASDAEQAERRRVDAIRRSVSASQSALREASRERERLTTRCGVLQAWLDGMDRFDAPVRTLATHEAVAASCTEAIGVDPGMAGCIAAFLAGRTECLLADGLPGLLPEASGCGGQVRILPVAGSSKRIMADAVRSCRHRRTPYALCLPMAYRPGRILGLGLGCVPRSDERRGRRSAGARSRPVAQRPRCLDALLLAVAGFPSGCRRERFLAVAMLPDGSVVCGVDERESATIERRQEIAGLQQVLGDVSERETAVSAALSLDQERLIAAEREHERTQKALGAADLALSRARDEARFQERLVAQSRHALLATETAAHRLALELVDKRKHLAVDQVRAAATRSDAEHARELRATARNELDLAQEALSAASSACRDDEQAASRLRDRATAAKLALDEQLARVTGIEGDLARYAERAGAATLQIEALRAAAEAAAVAEQQATASLQTLESQLRPLEARLRDEEALVTARRAEYHAATHRLAQAQTAYDTAHGELEGAVRELEVLRAQVSAELRCGLDDLPDQPVPHGAVARVRVLRAHLAAMGPVNARAEEDYAGAGERLAFLQTQAAVSA